MDVLGQRVARLETALAYETRRIDGMEYRIERMQENIASHPSPHQGPEADSLTAGMMKILLALLLPLAILLITGDPNKATSAAKLLGGG